MRHRAVPGPARADLFAGQDDAADRAARAASAPCIHDSPVRGPSAREAEFQAWCRVYGHSASIDRSHAWRTSDSFMLTQLAVPAARCQPGALTASLRATGTAGRCGHDGADVYRGCCLGCDWEGPVRVGENAAVEDACDHAYPGWRALPVLPQVPGGDRAVKTWLEKAKAVYPPGWIEAGGPVRTARTPPGTRHHLAPAWGGYDMGVPAAAPDSEGKPTGGRTLDDRSSGPVSESAAADLEPDGGDRGGEQDQAGEGGDTGTLHADASTATCKLTLRDLLGAAPESLIAELCDDCGRLHGGDGCPCPVTCPPGGLAGASGELTPLGAAVQQAADFLAARSYLDPDAVRYPDWEYPHWVLADLADLAREKPCGPGCRAATGGLLHPSDMADHFQARRQQEWERWLPAWACACDRVFKVIRDFPGARFYDCRPDGLLGGHRGDIAIGPRPGTVKASSACPGCGALFADTIAGYPVTPRPRPAAEAPATLF